VSAERLTDIAQRVDVGEYARMRDDIRWLIDRIRALEAAERTLPEPLDPSDTAWCIYCGELMWDEDGNPHHAPGCPWLVLQQTIEGESA
jgi:hypothetical protein